MQRDQLAEAGAGVWDPCLCRAEGVQAIYIPSSPAGKKRLKGLEPFAALTSLWGGVLLEKYPPYFREPPPV